MARINIFQNLPVLHLANTGLTVGFNTLFLQGVYIPGSISFNNVAVIVSVNRGGADMSITMSLGLYSLTGSTLSLANSAGNSFGFTADNFSWRTLATSATQDISPGNWYLGFIRVSSGDDAMTVVHSPTFGGLAIVSHGGLFVRGIHSVSQTVMPSSIATSDLLKEIGGGTSFYYYPYILISA